MNAPLATHDYAGLDAALAFVKRTRAELRSLRKVRLWRDGVHIIDVNKDYFEMRGIGYQDTDIIPLLKLINTAYNPETLHQPAAGDFKEFDTGRRHCWAEDRVM